MSHDADASLSVAIGAAAEALPISSIERLATQFQSMTSLSPLSKMRLLEAVPEVAARTHGASIFEALAQEGSCEPRSVALALVCASNARESLVAQQSVTPVWTGPASVVVPVRRTREVLLEMIREAHQRLLIVSFAAYKVGDVLAELTSAAARGVSVRLILETKADSSGRLTSDARDAFQALPASVEYFQWPLAHRDEGGASLHAKAVLVDGAAALVTSANLTGSALDRNIELGLLVRGGRLPGDLLRHFEALVEAGELVRLQR